jgi:Transglycosylase SLT domain
MTVRQATVVAGLLSAFLALVMVAYARVTADPSAFQQGQQAARDSAQINAAVDQAAAGAGATVGAAQGSIVPEGSDAAIPNLALRAYQNAASWANGFRPGSHLPWSVIAGIGRVESNHGRFSGSAARFTSAGDVSPPILGPELDGRPGFATIRDSDQGSWDGDRVWDRAVGPMQFIPSTWRSVGRDANGDRVANPHNLFDAAVTTAAYLCSSAGDLSDPAQLRRAIYAYNHSMAYVDTVLRWAAFYDRTGPIPAQDPNGSGAGGQPGTGRGRVAPTSGAVTTTSGSTTSTTESTTGSTTTVTTGVTTTTESTTSTSQEAQTQGEASAPEAERYDSRP